jgi:hypothetical protein
LKWINHQILTGVAVYTATGSLLFAAYGMAGAVLPDKMEGNPRNAKNYWHWRSRHRGWSHWPVPYLFVIAFLLVVDRRSLAAMDMWDMSLIGIYMMIGALLHILEDAICGKVPLLQLSKKIGIRLFVVGSFTEYFFCIAAVLCMYMLKESGFL